MNDGSNYVLDADVFIHAARFYYAFDLRTPFWNILIDHARNGRVESIDRVKVELERGTDELANWARADFAFAFASTDEQHVIDAYKEIIAWVQEQSQFTEAAKAEFAEGSDGWLIAYAMVKGAQIVTDEQLSPDAKRRVPLPNVCRAFNVRWCGTFEMLRTLGVRFT